MAEIEKLSLKNKQLGYKNDHLKKDIEKLTLESKKKDRNYEERNKYIKSKSKHSLISKKKNKF